MRRIIVLGLLLLHISSCKPKFDEATPKTGPVTEAVFASGSIEPKDAYMLTALFDGFIQKSHVSENDIVKDGQLLFQLDNRQQRTQVNIAKTNLTYAKINASDNSPALQQLKAQINAAKAKMQTDHTTLARYENLYLTHSVSRQDVDNARLNYESSQNNYNALQENYKATENKMRQELANTQSQLQNAEAGNQYYNLSAIGAGKVYQIFKKQGDLIRKGDQVAQIGNPDSIVINLDVDEGSISKVQSGQRVLIELNTEKNKTYEATISKIYPHFNERSQSYKVEARFLREIPGLISGTQLQANIITTTKDDAMLIPHSFVMSGNKVLVKKGEKIDTTAITTGIVSDEWIEVLTGLAATDKIVKQK
ncbi:MAG: efflux rane fusion protein [Flavipsychrobacter sp.]|jgi:multidrug efflux pump subunit AcrA (membrane-fusion protein)|nr:efflux rane fusion protein [Flavipsychrobacter sp.]